MTGDLISTLERAGEFDALSKLRLDEPYFMLIGRDGLAPSLIDQWADTNRRRAVSDFEAGRINREAYERECRKSTQAEMVACDMRAFKKGQPADPKEGPRQSVSYTGAELDDDTKRRDALHTARVRAVSALHNAVTLLTDLRAVVDGGEQAAWELDGAIKAMAGLASKVEPKRPGIER